MEVSGIGYHCLVFAYEAPKKWNNMSPHVALLQGATLFATGLGD